MRATPCRLRGGELSESPKEPESKSGVPLRVPRVRIPRSPLRIRFAHACGEAWAFGALAVQCGAPMLPDASRLASWSGERWRALGERLRALGIAREHAP